jgi:2-keto-4-pentenoate hydratase/2-oxohepta-3-ene-1,7-dioic acid hydratase in catechol pathway
MSIFRLSKHIFGYTLWNDMSARDVQRRELPFGVGPAKAKDWDGSNVLGPRRG